MSGRSTTATRRSSLAAAIAAFCPPGPDPITSRSKSCTLHSVTVGGRKLKPRDRQFLPGGLPAGGKIPSRPKPPAVRGPSKGCPQKRGTHMSKAITPLTRLTGSAQAGFAGFSRFARRRGRAALLASVPLLAAGALAAGCGTVSAPPAAGGPGGGSGTGNPATSSPPSVGSTPAPIVTGGPVAPGEPACTGWPQRVGSGPLPASFVPVAVLRCVSGYQTIPGKGQWLTATLERAGGDLAPLVAALRRPPEHIAP